MQAASLLFELEPEGVPHVLNWPEASRHRPRPRALEAGSAHARPDARHLRHGAHHPVRAPNRFAARRMPRRRRWTRPLRCRRARPTSRKPTASSSFVGNDGVMIGFPLASPQIPCTAQMDTEGKVTP